MKNLTQRLKVALLLFCGLLMLSGYVNADTFQNGSKLYLKPNGNWSNGHATFKAEFYGGGQSNTEAWFNQVSGQSDIYECTVPGNNFDHVNVLRYNADKNAQWDHIWNIPASNGQNLITISLGTWSADNSGYTWGIYNTTEPDPGNTDVYIIGDFSNAGVSLNDWSNGVATSQGEDDNQFIYNFTASSTGEVYFRFKIGNNQYGPSGDNDVTVATTGNTSGSEAVSGASKAFKFEALDGHKYEVKYWSSYNGKPYVSVYDYGEPTPPVERPERPSQLYVNVIIGETSTPVLMRLSDNGKQFHGLIITDKATTPTFNFNFRENENDWTGYKLYPNAANTNGNDESYGTGKGVEINNFTVKGGEPTGNWKYTLTDNKNLIVRVNLEDLEHPMLKIEEISKTGQEYYLHAGFLGNWDKNQRVKFVQHTDDPLLLRAVAIYKEANPGNLGFKITNKATADNGNWYSAGKTLTNREEFTDFTAVNSGETNRDFGSTKNTLLDEAALFQTVTFYLTLNEDGSIASLKPEWEGTPITVSNDMPVYPIGVYTEAGLKRYDQWPVMYLQARILNNNRITPEYQFTQVSADRYELELTMRETKMKQAKNWAEYDNDGTKITVKGFQNASSPVEVLVDYGKFSFPTNKKEKTDGARYKAICEKQDDGTWKLTFEPIGDLNDLPFLSMVSGGWIQRDKVNTPIDGRNTSDGWEQAWVQYDNRGNVLRDRKGNVMYNTMWPPRNPIMFKTEFEVGGSKKDFTLSSKDLTFQKVATKTGKQWKEDPAFKEYTHKALSYTNNEGNPYQGGFNAPSEYVNALALDDNTEYTLYRVENMWINSSTSPWDYDSASGKTGKKPYGTKIWSGWFGDINSDEGGDNQAIWCNHSNWGHVEGIKGILGWITDINPYSTEPLFNDQGDMAFDKPTFFKYVNFFYDVKKPQTIGHSVLFTELALGGAQIAAMSTKDPDNTKTENRTEYEIGNYQPALAAIDATVANYTIKSVTINSYMTTTNNGQESEEMVTRVFNWTNAKGEKKTTEFHDIFKDEASNNELPGNGDYAGGASTAKWVKDAYAYNSGDYFYRMTVVMIDTNGGEHKITVDSNPFTILKPEAITLNVYQLVKIGDDANDDSTDVVTSEYYTFKGSAENPAEPTLPAYKLSIVNDSKFDPTTENVYDENGNLQGYVDDTNFEFSYEALEELPEYGANCHFTDKVLIVGSVPSAQNVDGYAYAAGNASAAPANGPMKIAITEDYDRSCQRADNGDRFMHVTNVGSFDQREFTLQMAYSNMVLENGKYELVESETDPVSARYVAVVPEPQLREAHIDVFYGKDLNSDGEKDFADFKFRGVELKRAHYHSVRDHIEIEMPNVSNFLKQRMIEEDFFSIKIEAAKDPTRPAADQVWSNVFDFDSKDKPYFNDGVEQDIEDENLNIVTVHGLFLEPEKFNYDRNISLIYSAEKGETQKYNYYPRWKDGAIHKLEITDNAPFKIAPKLDDAKLYISDEYTVIENGIEVTKNYEDGRHLIAEFTIQVTHAPGEDGNIDENSVPEANHNYLISEYQDSEADGTLKFDEEGNPVIVKQTDHLNHHSENDYYYLTVIDRSGKYDPSYNPENSDEDSPATQSDETADDIDDDAYIITKNGLLASKDPSGEKCQYAVQASKLLGGSYYPIKIKKDYGTVDRPVNLNELLASVSNDNYYAKNLEVLVSYLYPFQKDEVTVVPSESTDPESRPGINRVVKDYTGDVIKSQATVGSLATVTGLPTGIENLNSEFGGSLKTGAGYIEVEGTGVQIFNAAGMLVGEGEGHHDVECGVYVVRYNGKTAKVVVR